LRENVKETDRTGMRTRIYNIQEQEKILTWNHKPAHQTKNIYDLDYTPNGIGRQGV
jgi:hypothetical protein